MHGMIINLNYQHVDSSIYVGIRDKMYIKLIHFIVRTFVTTWLIDVHFNGSVQLQNDTLII